MKTYNITQNIGRCKYIVNYHDGLKQHADGSAFFDIAIFSDRRKMFAFVAGLKIQGYKP